MRRFLCGACCAAALGFWSAPASAADGKANAPDVDKIVATGRDDNQVMDHLDVLCNRIGPRLTGSDALTYACEWTRDRFKSFGIENARIEPWGEYAVGFNRGPWFGRVVEPQEKALPLVTMSWSAGTKGAVKGKAVLAPTSQKELDEAKDAGKLAGAWVLSPLPNRDAPRPDPDFLRGLSKALETAKVAGVIRSMRGELLLTAGNPRVDWDKLPTTPMISLQQKPFDELVASVKDGKPVVLEFDIRNYFKKGPIPLYNVIADIPGTEKPDEYVIVGGHIDSWDGATGATDDGTGVSTTLEAARILMKSGVKPKRTIRFMLWSGEEQGLLGSAAYVKKNKDLMAKISAVLVHDGGTNYLSGIGATEAMASDLRQVFEPVVGLNPDLPFAVRPVAGLFGGGSDHASFLSANVPGFFWNQAGKANYNTTHHTQFDTFDRAIPEYQKHSSIVAALGAYGIANLDHLLSREKLRAPGAMAGRRTLGIQLEEMTVSEVIDDAPAQKAGMKVGDVIIKVDGKGVADRMEMSRAIQGGATKRIIGVMRNGKDLELTIEWPAPAPAPAPAATSKTADAPTAK